MPQMPPWLRAWQQRTNNTCVEFIDAVTILELEKWEGTSGPKKM